MKRLSRSAGSHDGGKKEATRVNGQNWGDIRPESGGDGGMQKSPLD